MSPPSLSTLVVHGLPLTPTQHARLAPHFTHITHVPDDSAPVPDADAIYGFPLANIHSAAQVPRVRFIQLASAGAEFLLGCRELWADEGARARIVVACAAGAHVNPIPQHFIMTTLALFHQLQKQMMISYVEKRWATRDELGGASLGHRELRGKTVGMLGYGHIGRESARLAAAFGAKIIAANSSGLRKPEEGYAIPGTGDPDGSLPSAWYSTSDPASFASFLSHSDVVLVSLPNTSATKHILNVTTLGHLKPSAVLINVGRGTSIDTPALVAALDEGRIAGAALDVTDPEPLPAGHPLFGRENVIVTPHLSAFSEHVLDYCLDILVENLRRWKEGKTLVNVVDLDRGY